MPASFRRQLEMAGQLDEIADLPTKPTLSPSLSLYYDAFFDLSTTRQTGFGISFISWLSVRQYAQYQDFDAFSTYFLHRVVKALDPIYVEHYANESKANQKR